MSSTDAGSSTSTEMAAPGTIDMGLEVVTLPVADVDRAKSFYQSLGWREDADIVAGDDFRVVQFTPPHSQASIHFGKGVTASDPGSVDRRPPGSESSEDRSYFAYASFSDPDGNGWLLQEIQTRLPGRVWED